MNTVDYYNNDYNNNNYNNNWSLYSNLLWLIGMCLNKNLNCQYIVNVYIYIKYAYMVNTLY